MLCSLILAQCPVVCVVLELLALVGAQTRNSVESHLLMSREVDKYDVSDCNLMQGSARQKGVDNRYFSVKGLGEYREAVDHEVARRSHGCPSLRIARRQLHNRESPLLGTSSLMSVMSSS